MQFSEWTNDNVLFLYFVMLVVFGIGFLTAFRRGGWNQHLPYMFTLLISFQYYLISPFFFYMNGKRTIIGTDISEYYGLGAFFPLLGLVAFICGYWIKNKDVQKKRQDTLSLKDNPKVKRLIIGLFCASYSLVFINMAIGGIDIKNIFLGDVSVGLGAKGETYFLQNLADSLITIIIMAYVFGNNKRHLIIGIALAFFLFTLLGFRHRILTLD